MLTTLKEILKTILRNIKLYLNNIKIFAFLHLLCAF